jgi:hypothetical protein
MTVVAWDGKTLAADRQLTCGTRRQTTLKVFKLPGAALIGCSGSGPLIALFMAWFNNGALLDQWPSQLKDDDGGFAAVVIKPNDPVVYTYFNTPVPSQCRDRYYVIGSGSDFAYAAMLMGKTAAEAVAFTNEIDVYCGGGVDTVSFEDEVPA